MNPFGPDGKKLQNWAARASSSQSEVKIGTAKDSKPSSDDENIIQGLEIEDISRDDEAIKVPEDTGGNKKLHMQFMAK